MTGEAAHEHVEIRQFIRVYVCYVSPISHRIAIRVSMIGFIKAGCKLVNLGIADNFVVYFRQVFFEPFKAERATSISGKTFKNSNHLIFICPKAFLYLFGHRYLDLAFVIYFNLIANIRKND